MATILGTELNDVLFGGAEDDFIDGGAGDDGMNGGPGNDTYVLRDIGDEVYEYPDEGYDQVIVYFSYTLPENVENLKLVKGSVGLGNSLDNIIQGNDARNTLKGFQGNDLIYGFRGNDLIDGGKGNDRLHGGGGDDRLIAGEGYDEMFGGDGDDTYIVRSYDFKIVEPAGRSSDTLRIPLNYELGDSEIENLVLLKDAQYGTGNDRNNIIVGNDVANVLSGLEGNDRIRGNGGSDKLYGSDGNDRLDGGKGRDRLYGQAGNDYLLGGLGDDKLVGENGRDVLVGYGGSRQERDQLIGGAGADTFVLGVQSRGGTYYLGSGFATIVDFDRRQRDKIQIRGRGRDYRLVTTKDLLGSSDRDTAIYKGKDLLAIVQDATIGLRDLIVATE